ncbi:nardilysin-like isoform x1 protein [Lasius niger]|uniref:Nardilysin-like isoform x1 protein n=1 Tax=Lasius niger TaxID=67767 RepID=A0A0J7K8F1_LASNI|nr:nardilysin-like isoform x1 protein [Lasius niger]
MPGTKHTCIDDERRQVEYLETPVKSGNDTKEYRRFVINIIVPNKFRVIKLQNGLTALLISDVNSETCASQDNDQDKATASSEPETNDKNNNDDFDEEDDEDENENTSDKYDEENSFPVTKRIKRNKKKILINNLRAACGLCVGVGAFSDPLEIPGMAHFLEHMVFMGSEKYPQENDFHAFLNKHGGSTNGKTSYEHTTFYFDVHKKHLLPTLDRFAQFFIKPLMKKDAITREREAVESEFQLAVLNDNNRKNQLISSFARAGHPVSKFTWGNLITLRDNVDDDKLYTELHKFRKRHYSGHRMKLAIQATLSLDILEEYVTTCFADVPSNGLPPDDFTEFKGGISFDTPAFRRMYKIKLAKDINQLEVTWAMPSLLDFYKSKAYQYISSSIGNQENGSLISYLRKKMWGSDMFIGKSESGYEHSSMYALLKLIVQLTDEGQKHLEEVLDAIFSFINFLRMGDSEKMIRNVVYKIGENESMNMHDYATRDYIIGNELYFEDNPEAIKMCLDYLKPENANIMIFDEKFNAELYKIEPWFKTRYTDVEIPRNWIERWKTIEPLPDFHLPVPNIFLTSDFTLIPMPKDIPKYPVKIHSDTISEIWYRPDPKFGMRECYMNFHFISSLGHESAEK